MLTWLAILSPLFVHVDPASAEPFRIIGYLTEEAVPAQVPFGRLTHINYAFLIPNDDGSLQPLADRNHLRKIVSLAHANGVKVLISVGGWGQDSHFEAMAASQARRRLFVRNLITLLTNEHLDGVDLDWEYPDHGRSERFFQALVNEVRAALPSGKLLTAAVTADAEQGLGIPAASFGQLDFVNIMAYDGPGENHSTLAEARNALDYWHRRGLPRQKLVLGLPFYSRPGEIPYRKLIAADPAAAQEDFWVFRGVRNSYNGLATITAKTRLALKQASGVMFWRVEDDSQDDSSLITAISRIARAR